MSEGRKRLDYSHPDVEKYRAEFDAIWQPYFQRWEEEEEKLGDWRGKDSPAEEILHPYHKACCEKTKELQKKYAYLFTVEDEEDR